MTLLHISLEETLEQLSHEIAGAFTIAFFELETIRNTAAEFGNEIEKLLAITSPVTGEGNGATVFDIFLENASSAAVAAERTAGSLTDRSFQGALIRISGSLLEMKKNSVALTAISALTKITQTETRDKSNRLAAFTASLDGRCRELQAATARSAKLVIETQRQSGFARDKLAAIGLEFHALSDGAGDEAIRLSALEGIHHRYMSEIRHDASRLDAEVKHAVTDLIGCLQFPDAFAQRVAHVRTAIAALKEAAPAERAALSKVAGAQLVAMANALTKVTSTASEVLNTLQANVARSPIIHNRSEAADPSMAWISATAKASDVMLSSVARARSQFESALTLLAGLTRQIDSTQKNLETSVRLNLDLETSVHNAALVAHRSGSQSSPLRFLAQSVKEVVDRTSDLIVRISDALGIIRDTSKTLAASSLGEDLSVLLELQESAAKEAADQRERVERLQEVRRQLLCHANRLSGAAKAGGNAFNSAMECAELLGTLAYQVDTALSHADFSENSNLDWLYAIYTMEEERSVHRAALNLPEVEESQTSNIDADLDDFMF